MDAHIIKFSCLYIGVAKEGGRGSYASTMLIINIALKMKQYPIKLITHSLIEKPFN